MSRDRKKGILVIIRSVVEYDFAACKKSWINTYAKARCRNLRSELLYVLNELFDLNVSQAAHLLYKPERSLLFNTNSSSFSQPSSAIVVRLGGVDVYFFQVCASCKAIHVLDDKAALPKSIWVIMADFDVPED